MRLKIVIIAILSVIVSGGATAQQFTMKGGAVWSKMHTGNREINGYVDPLVNYFYEMNYAYRFHRNKYWTIGIGYLGGGGTIHDRNMALEVNYDVDVKFSNLIFPVKFKISTEHRAHPRFYGYVGVAPAWMFSEDRTVKEDYDRGEPPGPRKIDLFPYNANKLQGYILCGCGVYYKHILLDIGAFVNTFNNYVEKIAPVSYNSGIMGSIGVQISRARDKRW